MSSARELLAPAGGIVSKQSFSTAGRLFLLCCASVGVVLGIRLLLSLFTGLPLIPPYLYSFDSINFALALEHFDPTRNQPQPPGYPFFVGEARLLNYWLHSPELTFFVLEIVICGLALAMLYILGKQMFAPRTAVVAAALLFANPVFLFSAFTSPLRPHLALLSTVVAYLLWRAISGEERYFYAASAALGLAGGFRPELVPCLLPLWVWAGWQLPMRGLKLFRGALLIGLATLFWIAVVVVASGGVQHTGSYFSDYLFTQAQQTSVAVDPRSTSWVRWAGRAILWNGLGVLPWIWSLPFGWTQRRRLEPWQRLVTFLALWFIPAFVFQLTFHVAEPDHVLSSIPPLCLLGAFCIAAAGDRAVQRWPELREGKALVISLVVMGNLLLFFGQFPVPQRGRVSGFRGLQSVEDAILIGTYESSYARVRWVNQMMELAMERIQELKKSAGDRPVWFVWARDGEPVWRKVCFYLPQERVYSLDEKGQLAVSSSLAQLWYGNNRVFRYGGPAPIRVPFPQGARLVWLIAPSAVEELQTALSSLGPGVAAVQKAAPLYYTDFPPNAPGFQWGSFEFAPR